MARTYGYRPSPKHERGTVAAAHLFGAAAPPPRAASIKQFVGPVLDQSITNSCVANSSAQAIRTAMVVQGAVNPELPSRLQIYFDARCTHNEQDDDRGTYVHSAFDGIRLLGFCPESAWPFDPAKVNDRPDWASYRLAADQRILGDYARLDTRDDIKRAIAAKHSCVFGVEIDQDFEDLPPGVSWPGPTGRVLGGHAMMICGYDEFGVEIVNSWGMSWSSYGFGRMLWEAADAFTDIWTCRLAPTFSEAA